MSFAEALNLQFISQINKLINVTLKIKIKLNNLE